MDLAAIQTGIESWLNLTAVDCAQNPPVAIPVEFGKQPSKVHVEPFVLAYLGAISPIGHDLPTYVYDELTDKYVETMYGVRRLVMRLSFRSFHQGWGKNARQFAEDFRIRTEKESSINTLSGLGLGLWGTGDLVETDYEWGGRLVSQVDMTVTLGVWAYERAASEDAGYIANAEVTGETSVITEYQNPVESEASEPVVAEEDTMHITVETELP